MKSCSSAIFAGLQSNQGPRAPRALEVLGLKRALGRDAIEHVLSNSRVAPEPVALALGELTLEREAEAVVAHGQVGGRVAPVLEDLAVACLKFVNDVGRVVGHARPEHVMVRALDDRDRVDLHVAQVLERAKGARLSRAEVGRVRKALRGDGERARFRGGKLGHGASRLPSGSAHS